MLYDYIIENYKEAEPIFLFKDRRYNEICVESAIKKIM